MQIILEGSRFTDQTWLQAHQAPIEMLPVLSEAERRSAKYYGISDEEYARKLYAGLLSEPALASVVERLGNVLQAILSTQLAAAQLASITLQTGRGLFQVVVENAGQSFTFSVREDVVNDLFEGGDREALRRLERVVEIAALPYTVQSRVS